MRTALTSYHPDIFFINAGMKMPPCTLRAIKWQYLPVSVSYQSENGTRLSVFFRYAATGAISAFASSASFAIAAHQRIQSLFV